MCNEAMKVESVLNRTHTLVAQARPLKKHRSAFKQTQKNKSDLSASSSTVVQ